MSRLALVAAGVFIAQGHASAATVGAPTLSAGALPTGGTVTSGAGTIGQAGSTLTINQQSQTLSLGWQSFNIGSGATVDFVQPNSQSVAVNRILGNDGSQILGNLNANGQVFLINPNGVLFGKTAQVSVGGLVASTLDVNDADLGTGKLTFSGSGKGSVVNDGTITAAQGGYVALVGNSVINGGVISARLGSVALVGGSAATLSFDGSSLIDVQVDQSTLNNLAQNSQLVAADGGRVWMTAGAHDSLLASAVNNTGVVQAQTVGGHDGHILLLSGMSAGTTTVSGTVDASAPNGGNGGAIETSGHVLKVTDGATLTTAAPQGAMGSWLIDPADFYVLASGGDITGAALSSALNSNNVTIQTTSGTATTTGATGGSGADAGGSGNIYVGDTVNWTSHTLTLNAYNDVDIYATMTAGGTAGLTLLTGQSGVRDASHGNVNVGFDTTGAFAGAVNLSGGVNLQINGQAYSIITSAAQLAAVQGNLGGHYVLGSNITMTAGQSATSGGAGASLPSLFTGVFDGLGHTVSGVSLTSSGVGAGLFGGSAGTIENVSVSGSIESGSGEGGSIAGLLVGWNSGTVRNSASSGTADGENGAYNVGGLVGVNTGAIFNSHSSATVSNKDGSALASGGLVGGNYGGSIANSYATGSVTAGHYVGGLVGLNSPNSNGYVPGGEKGGTSSISQSFATGAVKGFSDVGGLVGDNVGSTDADVRATISDSYATGSVTSAGGGMTGGLVGANAVIGEIGDASYASINRSYSTGVVSDTDGGAYVGGLVGCNTCEPGQFGGVGGWYATVSNSYWDTSTSGVFSSDGGSGLADYQMGNGVYFPGWDSSIWSFAGRPLLINDMVPLTVLLGNVSKTYDGQTFSTSGLSPSYSIAGAGESLVGDLMIGGDADGAKDAGTYSLNGGGLYNAENSQFSYNILYAVSTLTINKRALTGTIGAGSSVYGATLNPGAVSLSPGGIVAGDDVSLASTVVSVDTTGLLSGSGHLIAGAHTGIESATGALKGASANNYTFAGATGDYTVTQLALDGSIGTGGSTYGQLLAPGSVSFGNLLSGDDVHAASSVTVDTTGNLSTSGHLNAGTYKGAESVGGGVIGEDAGNYSFAGATGDYVVEKLALNGTIATGETTYGDPLAAGKASFDNLIDGDLVSGTVTVSTAGQTSGSGNLKAGLHIGAESVTALNGQDSGNYTIGEIGGDYQVDKLALTGSIAAGQSTYGDALTPGSASFDNALLGDSLGAATVSVNTTGLLSSSKHLVAGTHMGVETVTALAGSDAANYDFTGVTGDYLVNQRELTGTISSGSSTYGSALTPGSVTFDNALKGDDVVASGAVTVDTAGNLSTSGHLNAGTYTGAQSVGGSLAGQDSANYVFGGATGDYVVEKLALNGSIATGETTYGQTLAPGGITFDNLVDGDLVSGVVSVATAGQMSGSGHLVAGTHAGAQSVSQLNGLDHGNYTIGEISGDYVVDKLALTGSIGTGSSVYGSALAPGAATLTNVLDGDVVTAGAVSVNTTGLLSSSEHLIAGTHNGVESLSGLNGEDSGNYSFAGVTGNYTVSQLALTGSIGAGSSVYGSELTPGAATLTNVVDGDDVGAGAVTVATAGHLSTSGHLTAGDHTGAESLTGLKGADASNYSYANVKGDYTVEQLALAGSIAAGSSTYGAALTPGAASFTNAIEGDNLGVATVTVNTTGQLSGSGHLVAGSHNGAESVTGLSGVDAGNYSFAELSGNYSVSQLALTGAIGTGNSVYGSALTPGSASLTNVLDGDDVTAGAVTVNTTGLLSGSEHLVAGAHNGIESLSGLKGEDSGNYSYAGITGNYTVSQLALTGSIGAGSSVYGSELTPGSATLTNVLDGDEVGVSSVAVATSGLTSTSGHLKAGSYTGGETIAALNGEDAGNYSYANVKGDYTVEKLALQGSIAAGQSIYGDTLTPGAATFTNAIEGDHLGTASVTVATEGQLSGSGHLVAGLHTGAESVTGLSGVDAGNYSFGELSGDYTVAKLALIGSIGTGSSVYGSALNPGSATLTNVLDGDEVTPGAVAVNTTGLLSGSEHLIAGAHNGIESLSGLKGEDAGNYSFANVSGSYTVSQLALTGSIGTGSSVYGSALTPGAVTLTNVVDGDDVGTQGVAVATAGHTSSSGHLTAGAHAGAESISGLTGEDAANYSYANVKGDYTVAQLALTGSIAAGQSVYGSALTPGAASFTNVVEGDHLGTATVTVATEGQLSGSGHLIAGVHTGAESVTGLSGVDAANYSFGELSGNYTVQKLALTGSISTGSSVYGSELAPGAATLTNVIDGDSVVAGAVNVDTTGLTSGSNHLIAGAHDGIESLSGLHGEDAANYSFADVTGNYTVSQLALTGTIATGASTYGSALTPGEATFTNVVDGDDVRGGEIAVATTGQTSTSGHLIAGTHTGAETVASLAGEDAGNYSFANVSGDYTVGQLVLTGSISTGSSTYGSALAPGSVSFTNVVGNDDLGQATVVVATAGQTSTSGHLTAGLHQGAESITGLSGADAANYSFVEMSGNYQVAKLALSGAISAASSVYGSALAPGSASFSNAVSGDDVAAAGAVTVNTTGLTSTSGHLVAGDHAGIQSVDGSLSGADAGNYSFAGATGNYAVTKLALTGSIATGQSVYGSALAPGAVSFANAVSGDVVSAAGTVAVATAGQTSTSGHLTAGTHAGAESVDGSLGGADAGNYSFAGATGDYKVTKLAVSVTATGVDKLFDGSTADAALANVSGLQGDLLTASYASATFDDADPGNGKVVTVSGISLGGADAQNYALANTGATTTATITPATPPPPVQATTTDVLKLIIVPPPSVQFTWSASRVDVVDGGMKLPD